MTDIMDMITHLDPRVNFFEKLINDKSKRILELGPLNRPIADKRRYPNAFYCDIRSTQEVRELYSGSDYLKTTGITVDPETIVPIDFVVKGSYRETFKHMEKFDYVIASHVLEHMDDLIFSLQDIAGILNPGGVFCIIYPDKRYCFDHFRTSASFRDAYNVFCNGPKANAPMVLDFYYSAIPENNPYLFWEKSGILNYLPEAAYEEAVKRYKQALDGIRMEDVHYWPFSDMDFLKFLYDCTRGRLIPLRCASFCPCMENDQQFMVALRFDDNVMVHPEQALRDLRMRMEMALPDYYSSEDMAMTQENQRLRDMIGKQEQQIKKQAKRISILENEIKGYREQ